MAQRAVVRDYRALEAGRRRSNRLVLIVTGWRDSRAARFIGRHAPRSREGAPFLLRAFHWSNGRRESWGSLRRHSPPRDIARYRM